ncbi:UrvD/REP family ATP-dependent DNA helicase [Microbacterium sp. BK668]|uniref:UrvD/REP family ATP-dependent DNA helicase n=1 Tax=Microbacterium sp. BK668 TaxID=2512118 RepID=UPI0010E767B5|nr:UrvD/REP family ATP-dependent DNA helicase [Microbacterium sp. BK668]TDN92509.1 superfamily I DNA/RNA helicase [Microbacterium sp. BK668]
MKPAPCLDAAQRVVVGLPAEASGTVVGAPGTGKTTALIARVGRLLGELGLSADDVLVLTPTRQTATALRDTLGAGLDLATPGPLARSVASFAFQVVRAAAVAAHGAPPQLLTAGDQDRIIAELLAGDEEDASAGRRDRWPEGLGPALRASRQFRAELRALSAECSERAIPLDELEAVGRAYDRPAWASAASFLREYRDVLASMRSAHRDPAELVREAAALLAAAPLGEEGESTLGPAARLKVVLIDDAQELTPGGVSLVRALRRRGIAVMALGDPDIGSGAFRGASASLFAEVADELGALWVLEEPHRTSPALTRLSRSVTEAIGASGTVAHRRPPGSPVPDDGSVVSIVAPSPFEEIDRVARLLREWHVLHDVPWSRLAVIAHDARQVADLEVELAAREVPTRAGALSRPLGGESVVRDLVEFVLLGIAAPADRSYESLTAALLSPFGGLDAVSLRRLRARLRHAELAEGGTRVARDLLCEAMEHPLELAALDSPEARAAERVAMTLTQVFASAERGADVHALLWTVWDRARDISGRPLAAVWREIAGGSGVFSAEANRALDALVALFDAAKRFVERAPRESPVVFLRRILDSAVPEDILTAPDRTESVSVLTPASALGAEFDGVVIAGMQDGVWPNLRPRGGTLSGWRLADDVAAWRAGREAPLVPGAVDRRREALHDELRLFVRALSRARTRLAVTAVDDDDRGPSPLLSFLPDPDDAGFDAAEAQHPLTLRGLVALHRRTLTTTSSAAAREHAAGQLAVLSREGVPGAAPDQWFGIAGPSITGPLRDPERAPVPVSPSKLKTFTDCGLDWAIRALGGDTRTWSAGAGTILHAAMEEVPSGDLEELRTVVDSRWGELEFEAEWLSRKERAWAETLIGRLNRYLHAFHAHDGRIIGAEARFRIAVGMDAGPGEVPPVRVVEDGVRVGDGRWALLSGSIDRVEVYPAGRGEALPADDSASGAERVVIVDLKTGRSEARVSDDKVLDDAQLAAYQLAYLEGLVPGAQAAVNAGARLIVLSKTTQKAPHYRLARQAPMDAAARAAFLDAISTAANAMASDRFEAPIDAHCATSRFGVCALHTVKAVSAS